MLGVLALTLALTPTARMRAVGAEPRRTIPRGPRPVDRDHKIPVIDLIRMRPDLKIRFLDRRPPDRVVPACERPDDGLGANGVGAVYEDRADSEGSPVESGFLHEGHRGQDAVVAAEVVVEPKFVDEAVAVLLQELDTFATAARDPRGPGQRPEVVYAEDDGRRYGRLFFHPTIITARPLLAQRREAIAELGRCSSPRWHPRRQLPIQR